MNSVLKEIKLADGISLQLVQGDITFETTDAIVNAANNILPHGGRLAGSIAWRGAPQIQAESNEWVRAHGLVQHASPSIAIPAISTGIFGFPLERAARIILRSIKDHFKRRSTLQLVRVILFDAPTLKAFLKAWNDHFRPEPQT